MISSSIKKKIKKLLQFMTHKGSSSLQIQTQLTTMTTNPMLIRWKSSQEGLP